MKTKIALIVFFILVGTVSAQYGDPLTTFANICPSAPAPRLEAFTSPIQGVYFWSQYIDNRGNLNVVYFNIQTVESGRQIFAGDWCESSN